MNESSAQRSNSSREGDPHLSECIDGLSVGNSDGGNTEPREYELVHESATTRIFRCGEQGVKVLINPNLNLDRRYELLQFEKNVSRRLPSSSSQRKVLRIENEQSNHGMFFEWVDGVTVRKWLRQIDADTQPSAQLGSRSTNLTPRLQVALAITKAVCDFHKAGVFHCNLSLENVIINFKEEAAADSCTATLIDYAKCAVLSDYPFAERDDCIKEKTHKDLNGLGSIIYSVLSNDIPFAEQDEDSSSGEEDGEVDDDNAPRRVRRRMPQHSMPPAISLPLYILSLISSTLSPTFHREGGDRILYTNARDLLSDLRFAADRPDLYLKFHNYNNLSDNPLVLPQDSFYGRKIEVGMLQHSFNAMMEGGSKPCVLVVSGYAGAGKSSLLRQLKNPLEETNGYMIVCKFDQTDSPDTILSSGFDSFFEGILNESEHVKTDLKTRINQVLRVDVAALEESMPHLRVLLGSQNPSERRGGDMGNMKLRWKVLFSNLVYAISSQQHPIALVFEDLHWADEDIFDIIQLIVSERQTRHCLFCISYRGIESESKLATLTGELESQGALMWKIRLGSIEVEVVNSLVSETLCMPPTLMKPLSNAIRNKTGGTILFVASFLKSLHEERMIYFDLDQLRWAFDLDQIMNKEMSGDIIDFLCERVLRMPRAIQAGLKVAACLGSTFDLAVFQKANKSSDTTTNDFISYVTENGLLHELSPNKLTWSHDQLQEAAYSLIPRDKRQSAHLLIGARIYMSTPRSELESSSMIHDIVRNMNIGMDHLDSQERKCEVASLNLFAGEHSMKTSSFYSAANYFMTGIELLGEHWQDTNYTLGMKLFNLAADMLLVTGCRDKFDSVIEQPLTCAKNLEDRLPAHHIFVRYLISCGRLEEALATCCSVLSDLGEDIPVEVDSELIQAEIVKTRSMLASFPKNGELQSLRRLTDSTKIWMMKFMTYVMLMFMNLKESLSMHMGCIMTQRSIEYGWCSDSAIGLYAFGQALISFAKNVDEGCFWAKSALSLIAQFTDRARLPLLKTLCNQNIFFWKEPIQATSFSLFDTHRESLLGGQMESAMSCALSSCRQMFMSGTTMAELNDQCISVTNKMVQLKQVWAIMYHASLHCLVLKLMGSSNISAAFTAMTATFSDEDQLLQHGISTGKQTLVKYIYLYRLIHAFWVQDLDAAAQNASLYGENYSRFMDIYFVFYEGLTALRLALSATNDTDKWIGTGEAAVSTFQTWKSHSTWNFENKYLLLLAELKQVNGDLVSAEEFYKSSILSARSHKFVHEEGLAMESLGLFYRNIGREEDAIEMLMSARSCYVKWGASAIVERLDSEIAAMS